MQGPGAKNPLATSDRVGRDEPWKASDLANETGHSWVHGSPGRLLLRKAEDGRRWECVPTVRHPWFKVSVTSWAVCPWLGFVWVLPQSDSLVAEITGRQINSQLISKDSPPLFFFYILTH